MATQAQKIVRIADKQGRQYAVSEHQFKHGKHFDGRTYAEAGFEIQSFEDGTPYDQEPTKYAINLSAGSPEIGEEAPTTANSRTTARSASPVVVEEAQS